MKSYNCPFVDCYGLLLLAVSTTSSSTVDFRSPTSPILALKNQVVRRRASFFIYYQDNRDFTAIIQFATSWFAATSTQHKKLKILTPIIQVLVYQHLYSPKITIATICFTCGNSNSWRITFGSLNLSDFLN